MGKLNGKVAVVTGAASGIGRGIAVAFAAEGADIAVVDIAGRDQAASVLAEIAALGRAALYVRCDVSRENDVRTMASEVLGQFGRVDILVNNAGIFTQSLLADLPVDDWDRVVGVNLRGTFLCTRMLIGQMLERGSGRVINIASQLGQIGGTEVAHYCASKAGLVNAIAPGPIETPLLDGETEEWRSAKLAELPMRRFGTVAEVTPTAVLLASDDGAYYAGQTLGPNGGDVML